MTIDKNYNPLNPMVGQVKQFLDQKNIPREQVVPFLMSLGYPGLAGAVAGRMRLDQASEGIKALQQGQNAAPPTVVQENAQNAQQMQQQMGQAMAQPPQQPGPINMAGGGIVAFSNGSTVSGQGLGGLRTVYNGGGAIVPRVLNVNPAGEVLPPIDDLIAAYEKAVGNPTEQSRIQKMIQKVFPTFSNVEALKEELVKLRSSSSGIASKAGKLAGRIATPIAVGESVYQSAMTDPAMLAEEYGMDPNKFGRQATAQGLGYLENLASNLSFGAYGALRGRPYDRARAATEREIERINLGGIKSRLSETEAQIANTYNELVKKFGSDSQEARDFEAQYRQGMGRATPEGEDELARLLAQSAASSQAAPAGGAAAGPRLPGVSFQTGEMKAAKELRDRLAKLPGAEDFADPNKRQALIDREMAVKMEQYTKMGLFKPYDEAKEKVSGRLKELEGIKDKNFYKAMALMGFTMAGTKGSFFEALAAGGAAGISAYETFEERRQATLDKLQDRMMSIDMSIAGLKERAGTAASSRIDNLEQQKSNIENQITSINASAEQLQRTQSGQLAIAQMQIAADAARDKARFGGLPKDIERDIAKVREILENPALSSQGRQAAEAKLRALYDELSRATQAGSGSYQSALVRAASNQIPGLTPQSENDPYGVQDLLTKYGQ